MQSPTLCEGNLISKVELVLPKKVVETCYTLDRGLGAEFLSTNLKKGTVTRMKLFKQIDASVTLSVIVTSLQTAVTSFQPEHIFIQGVKTNLNVDTLSDEVTDKSDYHATSNMLRERFQNSSQPSKETKVNKFNVGNAIPLKKNDNDQNVGHTESDVETSMQEEIVADSTDALQPNLDSQGVFTLIHSHVANENQPSEMILDQNTETSSEIPEKVKSVVTEKIHQVESFAKDDDNNDESDERMSPKLAEILTPQSNVNHDEKTNANDGHDTDEAESCHEADWTKENQNRTPKRRLPKRRRLIPERYRHPLQFVDAEEDLIKDSDIKKEPQDMNQSSNENIVQTLPNLTEVINYQDNSEELGQNKVIENLYKKVSKAKKISSNDKANMKRPHYKREQNVCCVFCKVKLKDYDSIFDHIKLKHSYEPDFETVLQEIKVQMKVVCEICNKVISNKDQLEIHMNTMHKKHDQAKCDICGIIVKSEKHLLGHKRRVHVNRTSTYLCHLCPASFKHQAYLSHHIKHVHSKQSGEKFSCDLCTKRYANEKYLYNHKLRVHGAKKYLCKYCGKAFTTAANHGRHVLLLHERKNEKPHQCAQCGKCFTLQANLKDHIRTIHHKMYRLSCEECNRGFRRKKELLTHKLTCQSAVALQSMSSQAKSSFSKKAHKLMTHKLNDPSQLVRFSINLQTCTPRNVPILPASLKPGAQERVFVPEAVETMEVTADMVDDMTFDNVEHIQTEVVENVEENVQYILATPEILAAFGIKLDVQSSEMK